MPEVNPNHEGFCVGPRSEHTMQPKFSSDSVSLETSSRVQRSKLTLWGGRMIRGLVVLFLLFDGVTKIIRAPAALAATAQLGFSASQIIGIGALLLACTIVYVIPRTSILGAILLTGYLGGATATHVRIGEPFFAPIILGVLVWGGLFLRDEQLRELIPLRR